MPPLHVQSTQNWELFSEVPSFAVKLSTLCRQLDRSIYAARGKKNCSASGRVRKDDFLFLVDLLSVVCYYKKEQ